MNILRSLKILSIFSFLLVLGCKSDDDPKPNPPQNDEEVITTMIMTFTDAAGVEPLRSFTFNDPDGDGGSAPVQFDTIELTNGNVYNVSILLLNVSETPSDTISNEVADEADEHLFCFTPTGVNTTVVITDTDGNSLPLGLMSTWTAGTAGMGTMNTRLKHQPDGLKDGTCAPGESDIDLDWVIKVN